MGLGTDGARVMTGMGEGLTGYMARDNPMIVNYHCIAHKLALVTSQAADAVPYLVDYQRVAYFTFSKHLPIEHRDCQKFKSFLMNQC